MTVQYTLAREGSLRQWERGEARAYHPERATSMRSSHGVFTDQFIFRTVLARILNIF